MKNSYLAIILVVLGIGTWIALSSGGDSTQSASRAELSSSSQSASSQKNLKQGQSNSAALANNEISTSLAPVSAPEERDDLFFEISPATEKYQNATEALEAVKIAAQEYDDEVLEQFFNLGSQCGWCDDFYPQVVDLVNQAEPGSDEKEYFTELLSTSGRPEHVEFIVDQIKTLDPADQDYEIFIDALEVTVGDDQVVDALAKLLPESNPELQESVVAAISNHGSRYAVDLLYKFTLDSDSQDGFYQEGIGLGEVIPEAEAFPVLREIISKRDNFSHLAVKSLLNAGADGLQEVHNLLEGSTDAGADNELLKGALDHITFDDKTELYLKDTLSKSKNPALKRFSDRALRMLKGDS